MKENGKNLVRMKVLKLKGMDWDVGQDGPLEGNESEQTDDEGLFEDGEESVEWSDVEIWD